MTSCYECLYTDILNRLSPVIFHLYPQRAIGKEFHILSGVILLHLKQEGGAVCSMRGHTGPAPWHVDIRQIINAGLITSHSAYVGIILRVVIFEQLGVGWNKNLNAAI